MKKIALFVLILIIMCSISAISYAEGQSISSSKSKDIEQLLDLTITDAFIDSYVNGLTQAFTNVASAGRTTEDKESVIIIMEAVKEVLIDEFPALKKQFIPIYDEYFTHEEIKQLIVFYKEPIGQKFIKVMPQLTERGMELGKRWGGTVGPKIEDKLRKKGIKLEG